MYYYCFINPKKIVENYDKKNLYSREIERRQIYMMSYFKLEIRPIPFDLKFKEFTHRFCYEICPEWLEEPLSNS